MTPEDRSLILQIAGLLITAFVGYLTTKNRQEIAAVKQTVEPLPAAIDGAQDTIKELIAENSRLKGQATGVAQEKADQALRSTTTPTNPTPTAQASIPTAANPLVTVEKLEQVLKDQPPPTVIAVNSEGKALLSEETAVQLLGTPPMLPDETNRPKWEKGGGK